MLLCTSLAPVTVLAALTAVRDVSCEAEPLSCMAEWPPGRNAAGVAPSPGGSPHSAVLPHKHPGTRSQAGAHSQARSGRNPGPHRRVSNRGGRQAAGCAAGTRRAGASEAAPALEAGPPLRVRLVPARGEPSGRSLTMEDGALTASRPARPGPTRLEQTCD